MACLVVDCCEVSDVTTVGTYVLLYATRDRTSADRGAAAPITHTYGTIPTESLKLMAAAACSTMIASVATMAWEIAARWCA